MTYKNSEAIGTTRENGGLGHLDSGVMHEINNPTNFTHASLYTLRLEFDELFTFLHELAGGDNADPQVLALFAQKRKELESITDTAEEGTNRIKKIGQTWSQLSRVDKDKKKPAHIKSLIDSHSINLARTQYPEAQFDTQAVQDITLPCFQAKLSQVLLNLIVNACHAMGLPRQSDSDRVGQIFFSTEVSSDTLTVYAIADNGCGMDEDTLKKYLSRFLPPKKWAAARAWECLIGYSIMEEHGGRITVTSDVGLSTTVTPLYFLLSPLIATICNERETHC